MEKLVYLIIFIIASIPLYSQDNFQRKKAEKAYEEKDYQKSDAILNGFKNKSAADLYNQANNQYKLGNYEKALELYQQIPNDQLSSDLAYKLNHNMGNCQLQMKKYKEAISSYGQALQNNPNSEKTKYNLNYARKKIIQQQQQQQQQQNKGEGEQSESENESDKGDSQQSENESESDKGDSQQSESDKNGSEKDDREQSENESESDKDDSQQSENESESEKNGGQESMSKEDAEKLLDAFARENKKVQEKADETKNKKKAKKHVDKDW